ncbi:zinc ribbon domain-containing protein [Methylomarinum sp. Ch1-1]|uniref:Zinc ribbon domain-containing protein n=1 Tax=Methylomarinum roseum TaxID=3067653 RepID=A0AAU7NYE6_9GAMM|nr:zinc ribbon domain-containing protein [Methylomarinum sp. Ch1-1]MDP4521840.1 zinc ribbon domain-containing protein [Methylomarinum sp. Ch1-1]
MTGPASPAVNACRHAAQYFITMLMILVLGKLITWVPVMQRLQVLDTFTAADVVWFVAKAAALLVFYLFARYSIKAVPNSGGMLSFVKGIAEPLTVLVIVIIGQALLWQLLGPFVDADGRTFYYSAAIVLILAISVWLILSAYRDALYLVDSTKKVSGFLSRFVPNQRVICNQCDAEIDANANYCSQCGHKIAESSHCSECGGVLTATQPFCPHCGAEVNWDEK